ncbi:restriction endonuclease subunit S [Serratia oryzae]|uniref:restriction endonuclease subunit S n=1 Tax=Serratia oryzae TaxID=2034155 RepID=UPI0012E210A0|nr:restriction endonuclease subunit S [Serratia oryzae]
MSEVVLPENWLLSSLGEVCTYIQRGKGPIYSSEPNEFPVVNQKAIRWNGIEQEHLKFVDPTQWNMWEEIRFIRKGDILWNSTGTGTIGRACYLTEEEIKKAKVVDSHVTIVRTTKNINSRFAFFWIMHPEVQSRVGDLYTGTTNQVELSKKMVEDLTFPLPPLAEQKVIADKLVTLLEQVETTKARLERIPELLKTFRQSVLSAAVSGRLNSNDSNYQTIEVKENWAHEVEGRTHWKEYIFSDVIKIIGGSQPPKSEFSNEELDGYIRLIQIRDYKSDAHKVYIPLEKAKRFASKEDVMIGRYGPPIFQILRGLEGAYNVALMKAKPNAEILDREFLYWYLQNYKLFNYIHAGSDRTAGQTGVNKKYLESYPILVPPLDEQTEIVHRVEKLFAFADRIEQKSNAARERVNNLTQSILAKAFRGELTADWRAANPDLISGENSAEALLEKIKAEREAIKNQPNTKRTTVKKYTGNRMSKQIIKVIDALKEANEPLSGQQLLAAAGYPRNSSTDQLEQFFLDIREALTTEKSIVKLERGDDGQDWFALAKTVETNKV